MIEKTPYCRFCGSEPAPELITNKQGTYSACKRCREILGEYIQD